MELMVNNLKVNVPKGVNTVGELIESINKANTASGQKVIKVSLNDSDITRHDDTDRFLLKDVVLLEITTGDPKTVVRSALVSLQDFLEKLLKEIQDTAGLLRDDNNERSNQSFLRCLDGLQVLMHTLETSRRLLGISFELMVVLSSQEHGEITVAENRRRLFEVLDGMIEAQTNQDWKLLADLLEYELTPILEDWKLIIPVILNKCPPAPLPEA